MDYQDLISRKSAAIEASGYDVPEEAIAKHLFPHQRDLVRWAVRRGRAAIFAATGLGKGIMLLEWARLVSDHGRVLILAPLAVGPQLAEEAKRYGVPAFYVAQDDGYDIQITNYEKLHRFDTSEFAGIVLDESSILKSLDGKTKTKLIEGFAETPFRLACTATPAPNDFTELGNHSEFLGLKSRSEMLAEFFVHDGGSTQDWRVKGHAIEAFWRWVAGWGAVVRLPSDLGHADGDFALPPMVMTDYVVASTAAQKAEAGLEGREVASTLTEQRKARRVSVIERSVACAKLAARYALQDDFEWDGSLNMPLVDVSATPQTPSTESDVRASLAAAKRIASICESITRITKNVSENMPELEGLKSTLRNAPSTQPTPTCAPDASQPRKRGTKRTRELNENITTGPTTVSRLLTMSECLQSSMVAAPSVVTAPRTISTSTTATQQAEYEGCSAPSATSASVNSVTALNGSVKPQRTWKSSVVIWCDLNDEQDAVAALLGDACVSIQGSTSDDDKLARHDAWKRGDVPILVAKPSQFGFGLNWAHCHQVIFIGASHQFERTYQAIRRCWRFGQTETVTVDMVRADLEGAVAENYARKERDHERIGKAMIELVGETIRAEVRGLTREFNPYNPTVEMERPKWILMNTSATRCEPTRQPTLCDSQDTA